MFFDLLGTHFIHTALLAGTVVAIVAGVFGPLVVNRGMAFAVHGTAELGLTGAAGGLLLGIGITTGAFLGSITAGFILGLLSLRGRDRGTATGALLGFGLGLGVLFLQVGHQYATSGFGLLFGDITAVSDYQLHVLALACALLLVVLAVIGRPLWFASVDPETAEARGVPVRALGVLFPVLLAAAVAETIQVTGRAARAHPCHHARCRCTTARPTLGDDGGVVGRYRFGGHPRRHSAVARASVAGELLRVGVVVHGVRRGPAHPPPRPAPPRSGRASTPTAMNPAPGHR